MRRVLFLSVLCVSLVLSGCGYRFGTLPADQGDGPHRVHVPIFSNRTMEGGFEGVLTQALRREFSGRAGFELSLRSEVDLIVRGTVFSIVILPAAFSEDFLALKYRIEAVVQVEAVDVKSGEILWRADTLRGAGEYYTHADVLITDDNKREALHRIAGDLSASVCEMIWF